MEENENNSGSRKKVEYFALNTGPAWLGPRHKDSSCPFLKINKRKWLSAAGECQQHITVELGAGGGGEWCETLCNL